MKNIFSIVRGDTHAFELSITDNEELVTVDSLYFTVKENSYSENFIFQKKLDEGITLSDDVYNIVIDPIDTDNLEYGRYVFDVEIIKNNIKKTVYVGILEITPEVTFASNEG